VQGRIANVESAQDIPKALEGPHGIPSFGKNAITDL
jgi:hypothetical protein